MEKTRLDVFLIQKGFVPSRNKASELIHNGKIMVNGKVIVKPSFDVIDDDKIDILENEVMKYVSRGGLKLERALSYFKVDIKDYVILDIGASTGGFTDCALKHGAKRVYSLDVGSNQLHESLHNNPSVINIENTNFKDINNDIINEKIDMYVCDVSFISIVPILKKLKEFDENFTIIILYKPQFEVGKNNLNKKGVAKNSKVIINALNNFLNFLKIENIGVLNMTYSPIIGQKEGNVEFLLYLKNKEKSLSFDVERIVDESFKVLR